jgi:hypothetical protein
LNILPPPVVEDPTFTLTTVVDELDLSGSVCLLLFSRVVDVDVDIADIDVVDVDIVVVVVVVVVVELEDSVEALSIFVSFVFDVVTELATLLPAVAADGFKSTEEDSADDCSDVDCCCCCWNFECVCSIEEVAFGTL